MDQFVSHTSNCSPWNVAVSRSKIFANPFGCLSGNFDLPDDGILLFLISMEILVIHIIEIFNCFCKAAVNVLKINEVALLH